MNSSYLYLVINFLTILFPFLFSFYPKANFSKKWKYAAVAILIPGIVFIGWDEAFTQWGVWGFNSRYVTGITLGHLPLEETLFFICIPYACLFTYEALNYLIKKDILANVQKSISIGLMVISIIIGVLHLDKWYTTVTFLGLATCLTLLQFVWKVSYLGRFYFMYCIILIPFSIVNGILTGSWIDEPVVWYNDNMNLGIRMGTIPVEDIFYGMLLVVMNVSIFEVLKARARRGRRSN